MKFVRISLLFCTLLLMLTVTALAHHAHSHQTEQPAAPTAGTPLANAVVLIIRHAEKPASGSGDPGLTPAGQQRATAYAHYFETYQINGKPLHFDHLFATADTHNSERPRLTLTPLSQALGLPLDQAFKDDDVAGLAQSLRTQAYGKTILICWHHEKIPALLTALGGDPNTLLPQGSWPGSVYDWVIELHYGPNGQLDTAVSKRINEHLMPGDPQ